MENTLSTERLTFPQAVGQLSKFTRFDTLEDHTKCDAYLDHLQGLTVEVLECTWPSVNPRPPLLNKLAYKLLTSMGQARNHLKRNCLMRVGAAYAADREFVIPKELECPYESPENLKSTYERGAKLLCEGHRQTAHTLFYSYTLVVLAFAKILKKFYRRPITLPMAERISKCYLEDWQLNQLHLYQTSPDQINNDI